jgi:hypothetical protein
MIQRIQTVFLLLSAASCLAAMFMPLVYFARPASEILLDAFGYTDLNGQSLENVGSAYSIAVLLGLSAAASIAAVFLYKNRKLQFRFGVYSVSFCVGCLAMIGLYTSYASGQDTQITLRLGAIMPVVASILSILAVRAIRKDEKLIRSIDRIR